MGKKEKESEIGLANAMNNLADAIGRLQDPVRWQKIFSDGLRTIVSVPIPILGPAQEFILASPRVNVEEIKVSLTDEEREKMVSLVHEALKPQMIEFTAFVKHGLEEMPSHRLQILVKKLEEGKEIKLRQKPGCIYLSADGEEIYLQL